MGQPMQWTKLVALRHSRFTGAAGEHGGKRYGSTSGADAALLGAADAAGMQASCEC